MIGRMRGGSIIIWVKVSGPFVPSVVCRMTMSLPLLTVTMSPSLSMTMTSSRIRKSGVRAAVRIVRTRLGGGRVRQTSILRIRLPSCS